MTKDKRIARAKKELEGWDAAPVLREALKEMREDYRAGQRRAEVDGVTAETILDVPVMLMEKPDGSWSCESTSTSIFPGQRGHFAVVDRTERLAMAEFRFRLVNELVTGRFCREPEARKLAMAAKVYSVGRVPFIRVVSK